MASVTQMKVVLAIVTFLLVLILRPFPTYLLRDILSFFNKHLQPQYVAWATNLNKKTMYFKSSNFVAQATEIA